MGDVMSWRLSAGWRDRLVACLGHPNDLIIDHEPLQGCELARPVGKGMPVRGRVSIAAMDGDRRARFVDRVKDLHPLRIKERIPCDDEKARRHSFIFSGLVIGMDEGDGRLDLLVEDFRGYSSTKTCPHGPDGKNSVKESMGDHALLDSEISVYRCGDCDGRFIAGGRNAALDPCMAPCVAKFRTRHCAGFETDKEIAVAESAMGRI